MMKPRVTPPPPAVDGAKWIPLTKGMFALVDDADYEAVNARTWNAMGPSRSGNWYAQRRSEGKLILLHRWLMGAPNGAQVDHINSNGLDCRRTNMRVCSVMDNHRNVRKQNRTTSSRFKGVTWYKNRSKWMAKIKVHGKAKGLGRFDTEVAAAYAYNCAAVDAFGEFAHLNILCV